MKTVIITLALLMPGALLAEANVPENAQNRSFLLEAPGTISGMGARKNEASSVYDPPPQAFVGSYHEPADDGGYRFPQYGQKQAKPNPWHEMARFPVHQPPQQRSVLPQRPREFQNPWDMSNLPDFGPRRFELDSPNMAPGGYEGMPFSGFDSGYSRYPSVMMDPGLGNPMFPYSGLPLMNGMLPGLGKDDSDFPFMPFDLF